MCVHACIFMCACMRCECIYVCICMHVYVCAHLSMYGMNTCMCSCGVNAFVCMHVYMCVWCACMCGVDACVCAHVHVSCVNVCVCMSVEARGSYRQGVSSIAHDHIWGTGSLTDLVSLAGC